MSDENIVRAWGAIYTTLGGVAVSHSLFEKFSWVETGAGGVVALIGVLMILRPNTKLTPNDPGF